MDKHESTICIAKGIALREVIQIQSFESDLTSFGTTSW
jgi:hypothetical protein